VIDQRALLLAFSAGMVATVNPCGFAMLPAYLSYFLGLDDRSRDARSGVLRALQVGLAVSAGFLLVFFVLGVPLSAFAHSIQDRLPWVTLAIGVALVGLGIAMLRGFEPIVRLPKLQKGTGGRELPTMFLFGISYAVSSLSCTIPLFLALVASSFTQSEPAAGLALFLAYGAGMALVLMVLTLAIALARQGLVRRLKGALPYINRVAGGLLVLAGGYLAYYGWYEHQALTTGTDPGGPASTVLSWNDSLRQWIVDNDPRRIGIVLVAVLVVAVLLATGRRSGAPSGHRNRNRSESRSQS
jgi:cytochrome c biogenesis protein CcdA